MQQAFRASALVPRGFVVDDATSDDAGALITVRSVARASACPGCGSPSERVHSRYRRRLADLPISGRPVRLIVLARRFHCDAVLCGRRVFAERFDADVLAPWARRTARLDHIVHHLGLALGGRPAASFARRLMVPASRDTLLRAVRRRGSPRFVPPAVVGIDDWAWRRNRRYGTLIRDLERRRTIALLPDREPATAEAWLSEQPQIAVVARDRGGGYALAAARALPEATQVADRWHLMENASRAFLDAVRKSMRQIRAAIGAATIDPTLLTAAERIQYEGYLRREEDNAAILGLARDGAAIKEIVRRTGHGRGLVRKVLRLKRHGFRGCLRVVTEWATRRRQADRADNAFSRAPAARTIARLLTVGSDRLSRSETVTVAAIEGGVPLLVEAREIVAAFQALVRTRSLDALEPWLERAGSSLVASFAHGVLKDKPAVAAAITSPWSNGQTEGQITKLKLVKRQMYGRGKLDLLQARVIGTA